MLFRFLGRIMTIQDFFCENRKLLIGVTAAAYLTYEVSLNRFLELLKKKTQGIQCIRAYLERKRNSEFVPVGIVKSLHIYPIKSTKGHSVGNLLFPFQIFTPILAILIFMLSDRPCFRRIGRSKIHRDRWKNWKVRFFFAFPGFQSFCRFYTARQKPRLILLESCIVDNVLSIKAPDGRTIDIGLNEVKKKKDIRPAL